MEQNFNYLKYSCTMTMQDTFSTQLVITLYCLLVELVTNFFDELFHSKNW